MESSGAVFIRAEKLDDPYVVRHEVAHQWFPWLVGSDQQAEPWLDEAIATYLAGGLRPRKDTGFCSTLPVNWPVVRFRSEDPKASWAACDGYVQTVYYKGSWMLDAIRLAMGDEAFRRALAAYSAEYRFAVATGRDLLDAFRTASGAVTDELLEPWLDTDLLR